MSKFNCTKCGLCCKYLTKEHLKRHNLPESPKGGCGYLKEDNTCGIYETRPLICRIDEGFEMVAKKHMTKEEWYKANEKACKELEEYDKKQGENKWLNYIKAIA